MAAARVSGGAHAGRRSRCAPPLGVGAEAEREGADSEYNVGNWDFVSPNAVIEEYMENIYQCVSSI